MGGCSGVERVHDGNPYRDLREQCFDRSVNSEHRKNHREYGEHNCEHC